MTFLLGCPLAFVLVHRKFQGYGTCFLASATCIFLYNIRKIRILNLENCKIETYFIDLLAEVEPLECNQLFNMYYSIDACGARLEPVLNPQLAMLLPVNVPRYNDTDDFVENADG